jgi:hypothetical protein
MKKIIVWLAVIPALLLSGCSAAPEEIEKPVGLTSLTWEQLSETPDYKDWIESKNCVLDNLDDVENLVILPIKESESSPTPREIMVSRTGRIKASMGTQESRLKMLRQISDWDEYSNTHSDPLSRIWMNPKDVFEAIDNWELDRFDESLKFLSSETFSTPVRDKVFQAWNETCENDSILQDVTTTINEYDVALEGLIAKVVSDFENQGYKQFFDHILIKRTGKKTEDGWRYLTYSAVQFRYCAVGYSKVVNRFEFAAPGLVDADGIKAEDRIEEAFNETGGWPPRLGLVREYLHQLDAGYAKTNDYSGLKVVATWDVSEGGRCH